MANNVAGTIVYVAPPTPPAPHVPVPMPTNIIDVRAFGAIPNDGLDDTAAIQAAIDSLQLGTGMGATTPQIGGIVQFPIGTMQTSAPIRLPSGVWLRGQEDGSIIENVMPDASLAAIELVSPFTHGNNVGAGIDQIGINTTDAAAIKSESSITGELKDLHLAGVRISSGGVGVDFRNVLVSYLDVDRIVFTSPGTTAIWIGRPDNLSHDNIIRGVRMAGDARPDFVPERALWVMYGKNRIEGGSIEDTNPDHPVLPFYGSGALEIYGLYMEFPAQPDGLSFVFENVSSLKMDRLYHINAQRRIKFTNVNNAEITNLNIDGTYAFLGDCIVYDSLSHVTIDAVNGMWDSGLLDDANITVKGFYNENAGNFVETSVVQNSPNLVKDPNFTSVGDDIWNVSDWQITWGTGYQGRLGSFSVETVNGVKRLRIDVPNMVNVGIHVRLNVAGSNVGRNGIGRWRIDGLTQAFVYTKEYAFQYSARDEQRNRREAGHAAAIGRRDLDRAAQCPGNVLPVKIRHGRGVASAQEKMCRRSKWRRGESNPRPEITEVPASTCLDGILISIRAATTANLRAAPDVFISSADQRPNQQTSPLFAADVSRALRRAETALIRQPLRGAR